VLKIETKESGPGWTVLRLEGQILGPWIDELALACQRLTGAVELDLAEVTFVERRGVELLRALAARDVTLRHCTPFVAELLRV
jgi:hypothetical protein